MLCTTRSVLILSAFTHFIACATTCSTSEGSSSNCESRAGRSLLQQEKAKLLDLALEEASESPSEVSTIADAKSGSTKLLHRMVDTPSGRKLGLDISLLETAFAKHKMPLQHKEAKELLHSASKGRGDPKGMRYHVEMELLPMAEQTKAALQTTIDNAMEAVNNCSKLMWNAETSLAHREEIYKKDTEKEYDCLLKENEASHEEKDLCERVEKMIKVMSENEPAKVKSLHNKSATEVLPVMKANSEYYNTHFADFSKMFEKCKAATDAAHQKHKECDVDKEVVQKFFCYMKAGRDSACAEYATCFKEAFENYKGVKSNVQKTEGINKEHFTQMACSVWAEGATSSACESNIADTTHLDVNYPEEPVQATCVPMMKLHSRRDTSNFTCGESNASSALDDMFATPATPAPATPEPIEEGITEGEDGDEPAGTSPLLNFTEPDGDEPAGTSPLLNFTEPDGDEPAVNPEARPEDNGTAEDQADFTQITFDGKRCTGAPPFGWGNLGTGTSEAECKQACKAKSSCAFVVLRSDNDACTEFSVCDEFREQEGKNFTTWKKADVSE